MLARSLLKAQHLLHATNKTSTSAMMATLIGVGNTQTDEILVEASGSARILTLNRPKALNALNLDMIHTLHKRLTEFEADEQVRLIVIKGSGGKAFCAGGDVVAVRQSALDGTDLYKQFFYDEYIVNHLIGTYQRPYVALLNGITMGGGVGISVHGRYRVATDNTLFAMPETAIGLFPDVGGGYFLPRLPDQLGMYLALTGDRLQGVDVLHAGVATHFCSQNLMPALEESLYKLETDQMNGQNIQRTLDEFQTKSFDQTPKPAFSLQQHRQLIKRVFDSKTVEEIFIKLLEDKSDFAKKTLATLSIMSPTSLKITHRQLRAGALLNFDKVFEMEYRITQHLMEHKKDFFEGVKTKLIDKKRDEVPKWDPSTLEAVDRKMLDRFFLPLNNRDLVLKPTITAWSKI